MKRKLLTKKEIKDISEKAKTYKVFSEPTRLAVATILGKEPDTKVSVRDIIHTLEIEPTLLSHHLKIMRDAKVVSATRKGKEVTYSLV